MLLHLLRNSPVLYWRIKWSKIQLNPESHMARRNCGKAMDFPSSSLLPLALLRCSFFVCRASSSRSDVATTNLGYRQTLPSTYMEPAHSQQRKAARRRPFTYVWVASPDRLDVRVAPDLQISGDQWRGKMARRRHNDAVGRILVKLSRQIHGLD